MSNIRLSEICSIQQGKYVSPESLSSTMTTDARVPVWGANGIIGYTNSASFNFAVPLLTCRGNGCGLIQWTDGACNVSNNAMAILPLDGDESDIRFLYYSLLSTDFSDVVTGSAQPQITATNLRSKSIPWTSKDDRKVVSRFLSKIDEKIVLNQSINQTLESIAKRIFKSWFVDFDPVRLRIAGRPTGLPDAINELFPNEIIESEFGDIPKGWKIKRLEDVAVIEYGKNLPTTKLTPHGYPVFGGNGQIGCYMDFLYPNVMTLVACRGAASGRVMRTLPNSFVTNNSLVINHLKTNFPSQRYIEFSLSNADTTSFATGSAQPQITIDNLRHLKVLVANMDLIKKFQEFLQPSFDRFLITHEEIQVLEKLRDSLISKLVKGTLQIPDTEKLLEEVGI